MSQNLATEGYIFPTGIRVPIDLGLNEPPLRSVSTNLAENKEHINMITYQLGNHKLSMIIMWYITWTLFTIMGRPVNDY
jgi:hypothetical protein